MALEAISAPQCLQVIRLLCFDILFPPTKCCLEYTAVSNRYNRIRTTVFYHNLINKSREKTKYEYYMKSFGDVVWFLCFFYGDYVIKPRKPTPQGVGFLLCRRLLLGGLCRYSEQGVIHIFSEDAVSAGRIVDKNMSHRPDQHAVLNDGAAAHTLNNSTG